MIGLVWVVNVLAALAVVVPAEEEQRVNIVLINLDDADIDLLDEWAIDRYFPNIRRLIQDQGVRFSNFHVIAPLCGPSRGSLFRGQYPHNTGIEENQLGWKIFYDRGYTDSELGMWMRDAGYETALVGKYCHEEYPMASRDPTYSPPGWDHFHASSGGIYFGPNRIINGKLVKGEDSEYRTDLEADSAVRIVQNHDAAKPLFLYVAPLAPHMYTRPEPGEDLNPGRPSGMVAPRFKRRFSDLRLPDAPDFDEADIGDKTAQFAALPRADARRIARMHSHYRERVQAMLAVDEMVGRILDALVERGMLDRTFMFLTSDNGFQMLHHRTFGKRDPFDRTTRVQLLVRGPGVPEKQTFRHLLGHIDLVPTLLELGGARSPHFVDGKSFVPLLTDPRSHEEEDWQLGILIENVESKPRSNLDLEYQALRRFSDVYVEWTNGDREYYDLAEDPWQLEQSYESLGDSERRQLANQLAQLARCSGARCSGGKGPDPIDTTLQLENDHGFATEAVLLRGGASDDSGVARVEVVVRDVASRHYLGASGFAVEYATLDAELSAVGVKQADWHLQLQLKPGEYWVSARAFDAQGNEDPVVPTAFFSVAR